MTAQKRVIELEINKETQIVRISCFPQAPSNCAQYLGKRLREVVLSVDSGEEISNRAALPNGTTGRYALEPSGQYTKCLIFSEYEKPQQLEGSYATIERTAEILRDIQGTSYTFLVGACSVTAVDQDALATAQRLMLDYVDDPMAIITTSGVDIVAAVPRIEPNALGAKIELFKTGCIGALGHKATWKLSSVTLAPPYDLDAIVAQCRSQASTGQTFSRDNLRDAA